MTISVVQGQYVNGNPPWNFSSAVTTGNTVFLIAYAYTTNGSAVTASAVKLGGNTIPGTVAFFNSGGTASVNSSSLGGNVAAVSFWMMPNVQVASQTAVDCTLAASVIGAVIYEVSGLGTSPSLDQSASNSSTSLSSATSGATGAITAAPEIILGGAMIFAGGAGAASGWTTVGSGDALGGYQIANSSGGTYTWTQSGSAADPWAAAAVTVQGTAATVSPVQMVTSAPYRPPPPGAAPPAQLITGPLAAVPAQLTGIIQPETVPYRLASAIAPQIITEVVGSPPPPPVNTGAFLVFFP